MNSTEEELECSPNESYDFIRFSLIVYFGTPIAIAGVVCNWILFRLFTKNRSKKTPTLYLLLLAIMDLMMDLLYIPFFTVDALAIYHENQFLYHLWHVYAMFIFGLSRMIQFASTYLVLCATLERFIVVSEIASLQCLITTKGRYRVIIVTLFFAFCLRLPAFFEYYIIHKPGCPDFMSYDYVAFIASWKHYQLFNFYVMTVLHVFVPFAFLLVLNIMIVVMSRRKLKGIGWAVTTFIDMPKVSEIIRKESMSSNKRRRDELRYATWTMVSLTTTYLICASLSLFISVLENVSPENELLRNEEGYSTRFYTLATDLVSILVAVNSLLRLFVYMLCSPKFREDLLTAYPIFNSLCRRNHKSKKLEEETKMVIGYQNLIMGPRAEML